MTVESSARPIDVARDEIEIQISRVEKRLAEVFADRVPSVVVHQHVEEVRGGFEDARITQFVPILVESITRQRLLDLTRQP